VTAYAAHTRVVSHHLFTDEPARRAAIALTRDAAAARGYRGRVRFARYAVRGPGLGANAIEIQVLP
jgi:hypothetical protein